MYYLFVIGKIIENMLEELVIDIVIILLVNLLSDLDVECIDYFILVGMYDYIFIVDVFDKEVFNVVNECLELVKVYVV